MSLFTLTTKHHAPAIVATQDLGRAIAALALAGQLEGSNAAAAELAIAEQKIEAALAEVRKAQDEIAKAVEANSGKAAA